MAAHFPPTNTSVCNVKTPRISHHVLEMQYTLGNSLKDTLRRCYEIRIFLFDFYFSIFLVARENHASINLLPGNFKVLSSRSLKCHHVDWSWVNHFISLNLSFPFDEIGS